MRNSITNACSSTLYALSNCVHARFAPILAHNRPAHTARLKRALGQIKKIQLP